MKTTFLTIFLALGSLLASPLAAAQAPIQGVASVIDGDTLDIHGQRIRFHGVDAPESSQQCFRLPSKAPWRCGQRAALALSDFIGRRPVSCIPKDTDRYGRTIAVCQVAGQDLNAWMVDNGWAVAYARYSRDYVANEARAHGAGKGIWTSAFAAPWDYRASQRPAR